MRTLDTSAVSLYPSGGSYNLVGNHDPANPEPDNSYAQLTEFKLTLKRDNTGYRCYYEKDGQVMGEQLFYDLDRHLLTQIDKDNIYIGFFASRYADITYSDIKLTITNPEDDDPAEERIPEIITPVYKVYSPAETGSGLYELIFLANADGEITIEDTATNRVLASRQRVTAKEYYTVSNIPLSLEQKTFKITFTPDKGYEPDEYQIMGNYDTQVLHHTVTRKVYGKIGESLYVSPTGTAAGTGTKESPFDVYTAVKYVRAGQMILLEGGTYNLTKPLPVQNVFDNNVRSVI